MAGKKQNEDKLAGWRQAVAKWSIKGRGEMEKTQLIGVLLDDFFSRSGNRSRFQKEFKKRYPRIFAGSLPRNVFDKSSLAWRNLVKALADDLEKGDERLVLVATMHEGVLTDLTAKVSPARYRKWLAEGVTPARLFWSFIANGTEPSSRKLAESIIDDVIESRQPAGAEAEKGEPAADKAVTPTAKSIKPDKHLKKMEVELARRLRELREKDRKIEELTKSIAGLHRQSNDLKARMNALHTGEHVAEEERDLAKDEAIGLQTKARRLEHRLMDLAGREHRLSTQVSQYLQTIGRLEAELEELRGRADSAEDPSARLDDVEEMINDAVVQLASSNEIDAIELHDLTGLFVAFKNARPLFSRILFQPEVTDSTETEAEEPPRLEIVETEEVSEAADEAERRHRDLDNCRRYIDYYVGALTHKHPEQIIIDGHNLIFRGNARITGAEERRLRGEFEEVLEEAAQLLGATINVFFDTMYGIENPEYGHGYRITYVPRQKNGEMRGADAAIIETLNGIESGVTLVATNDRRHIVPEVIDRRNETGLPIFSMRVDNLYFLFRELRRRRELSATFDR